MGTYWSVLKQIMDDAQDDVVLQNKLLENDPYTVTEVLQEYGLSREQLKELNTEMKTNKASGTALGSWWRF